MAAYPPYNESERKLPAEVRIHLTHTLLDVLIPLPDHADVQQRVSCALRSGYVPRNPMTVGHWQKLNSEIGGWKPRINRMNSLRSIATGFNIIGLSGGGKTSGSDAVVDLYPQVIYHNIYKGRPFNFSQVVWLKMTCPFDGSVKGLCNDFFKILDDLLHTHHHENYAEGKTTDDMIPNMARVAAIHGLGALLIDEIQFLSESNSGGRVKFLNFFCDLTNRIGLPVIFIGTYKALRMLSVEFRQIRRGFGEGEKHLVISQ